MSHLVTHLLLPAGLLLLVFAALHDICFRTVPNGIPMALVLFGAVLRLQDGSLRLGLACGLLTFVITYFFWRFGWVGGADAKLLSAVALFTPPPLLPTVMIATSLSGGVLALVYLFGSKLVSQKPVVPATKGNLLQRIKRCELWRLSRRGPLPYVTAIATGSLLAIAGA